MSNTIKEGDVIDIYYISPQKCFRDIGIVKSVSSFEYVSYLAPYVIPPLEGIVGSLAATIIYAKRDKIIVAFEKIKKWTIKKRFWPIFFSEFLKKEKEFKKVKKTIESLKPFVQIGKQPPSTDIYSQASEELWSIQVTYSEALRAELHSTPGLLPLISSCKNNKNLVAKICVADAEHLLPKIAETEVSGIYGKVEAEKIQSYIAKNAYPTKSVTKFLYPSDLDYIRKLNDMYAAIWLLKHEAKKEGVDSRIDFYTYANRPTLRATFVYGESKILDFVYFPENWIGMTGTMFRCELLDGTPINTKFFKEAENEREKLGLRPRNDLIEAIRNELIERIDERGLNMPSFDNNRTKKEMMDKYSKIDKNLKYESRIRYEERRKFLTEIQKREKDKLVSPEPEIIVLPHK